MKLRSFKAFLFAVLLSNTLVGFAAEVQMKKIRGGVLKLLYESADGSKQVNVDDFLIDERPVTNSEYFQFVKKETAWLPRNVSRLFAEEGYLKHMRVEGTQEIHNKWKATAPVTNVSWFAASAYCASLGKRLPSENEWEYVARASENKADGSDDSKWNQTILDWYGSSASPEFKDVKQGRPNFWGVYDLHGLIWEWVDDFNSSQVISDSRQGGKEDKYRFCGGGALSAENKVAYANFMRFAFRSSLQGTSTISHLGFRCVKGSIR